MTCSLALALVAPTEAVLGCAYIATGSYPWNAGMFIVWPGLEKIMIDHAVTEPAALEGHIAVVPTMFGMCCTLFFFFKHASLIGGAASGWDSIASETKKVCKQPYH